MLPFLVLLALPLSGPSPISTPALSPAPGIQSAPAIASDGRDFLVVWQDQRTGLQQPNSDIYAARVAADGRVLDPAGIALPPTFAHDLAPSVVWNGASYVVANGSLHPFGVALTEVHTDGTIGATNRIVPSEIVGQTAISWNGSAHLVMWAGWPTNTLYAALVDRSLRMIGEPLALDQGTLLNPATASNGTDFLVTWQRAGQLRYAIVGPDGAIARAAATLGDAPPDSRPAAAWDGVNYAIVSGFRVTQLSARGDVVRAADVGTGSVPYDPAIVWNGTRYVVTWSVGLQRVYAIELDAALGMLADDASIVVERAVNPAIAVGGGQTMLVWADSEIRAARLTDGPMVSAPALVSQAPADQQPRDMVAGPLGTYGLIWREEAGGVLRFGRISSSGVPFDGAGLAVAADIDPESGSIAVTSDGVYAIVFQYTRFRQSPDRGVYAVLVDATGRLLTPAPIRIVEVGQSPSVASSGREFFVVWGSIEPVPNFLTRSDTVGRVLRPDGTLGDPRQLSPAVTDTRVSYLPGRLAWSGSEYVYPLIRRELVQCRPSTCTYAEQLLLAPSMTTIAERAFFRISGARVTVGASELLVTWTDRLPAAQRVMREGPPIGAPIALGDTFIGASAVWDGERFVAITQERVDPVYTRITLRPLDEIEPTSFTIVARFGTSLVAAAAPSGRIAVGYSETVPLAPEVHLEGPARAFVRFTGIGRRRAAR